jgi:uncharacterized protein YcgI (DUF1989 family)
MSPPKRSDRSATEVVPARRGRAFPLAAGERIAILNTHGSQVVDTWALVPPDFAERLSMSHTRIGTARLRPRVGDQLFSDLRRPILTLVEDSSPGVHDTLYPACDPRRYELLGAEGHDNCADNFRAAVGELTELPVPVPDPLNLFMNIPWAEEGGLEFAPPVSRPGDRVTLRAERDVVVVLSACPQDMVPINGPAMEPADVHVEILR